MIHVRPRFAVATLLRVLCSFLLVIRGNATVAEAFQQSTATGQQQQSTSSMIKQPVLEDGTPVELRFSQTVSSEDAHVNDQVEFEVLEEIKVSDVVVVPKGGIAWGTVTEAQPKRRMARGGKLEIVMDSVRLVDGEKAALRATKEVKGGGHSGAMTAGIVATGLILWPAAPFFLFMHGKEVTIPKGTELPAFVSGNFPLELPKFQQTASGTPQSQPIPVQSSGHGNGTSPTQPSPNTVLEVASTPTGAEIQLDGSFVGSTPSTIDVAAGDHTIAMNKNGYKLWERKIKVDGGKISVAAELEAEEVSEASKHTTDTAVPLTPSTPPAPSGDTGTIPSETPVMIYITSDPDGAEIDVDDAPVGKAPITVKLKPGKHAIRMFMDNYQNWVQWITIWAGADVHIKATLTKSNQ
jgi:hypothetical protein